MTPFITTDQLAAAVKRDLSDDLLMAEIVVEGACDMVRHFLDQQLDGVVDDVVVLGSQGGEGLLVPELPLVNVSKIEIRGKTDALNVTVPATSYWVDQKNGIVWTRMNGAQWFKGHGIYQVTYTHGWDNPAASGDSGGSGAEGPVTFRAMPKVLVVAALTLAVQMLDQGIVNQETVGQYQAMYAAQDSLDLPKGMLRALSAFRPGRRGD